MNSHPSVRSRVKSAVQHRHYSFWRSTTSRSARPLLQQLREQHVRANQELEAARELQQQLQEHFTTLLSRAHADYHDEIAAIRLRAMSYVVDAGCQLAAAQQQATVLHHKLTAVQEELACRQASEEELQQHQAVLLALFHQSCPNMLGKMLTTRVLSKTHLQEAA